MKEELFPTTAWVVQKQDSAVPPAPMAVQVRPPRSIPKTLQVNPVPAALIRGLITQEHYLHSMPAAARLCFGVYQDDVLAGAVVFTAGARQGHKLLVAARPQEVATLARLWLSDALPKNAESRVIGVVLRHLRRHTDWKLLLSYADPSVGHVGISIRPPAGSTSDRVAPPVMSIWGTVNCCIRVPFMNAMAAMPLAICAVPASRPTVSQSPQNIVMPICWTRHGIGVCAKPQRPIPKPRAVGLHEDLLGRGSKRKGPTR